ncbi:MAG: inorganic phosphate transporter [Cytophagales bacterium]|nr:inorganic phosphate transporter [Bernardetiaceae bacterium]MDW8203841.1 inorganic phosphate transporter [Cytophagales bacterium]
MFGLELSLSAVLIFCILCALAFEFINGFHDTANAVATVIYTNSLRPIPAVVWSGIWNFIGVLTGGISVAIAIINILPIDTILDTNIGHSVALVLAILLTAIFWNLGTWYLGLPCSSSHTLIGSIIGAGFGYSLLNAEVATSAVNWGEARKIGSALLFSPLLGFGLTVFLMFLLRFVFKADSKIFREPPKGEPPPWWIRTILILTCTGVSYSHGSNDGQKGIGLVMLVLVSFSPVYFALDTSKDSQQLNSGLAGFQRTIQQINLQELAKRDSAQLADINSKLTWMQQELIKYGSLDNLPPEERFEFRKAILLAEKFFRDAEKNSVPGISQEQLVSVKAALKLITPFTNYAPVWVILAVALSLGFGTMVGWKRIVVTIGEKIGKQHLTYAQGASAETVAAGTIGLASALGLSVSTTQVLSSGIAGAMVASNGLKNLQGSTIKNILIAWLLTFPVCMAGAGTLFLIIRWLID